MEQTQLSIEQKYSRKSIRSKVEADIDIDHFAFKRMVMAIDKYRSLSYYPSKQARIYQLVGMQSIDIATEIFIS